MALFGRNHTDAASPETSHGGPVYDARIDPAIGGELVAANARLQMQRDLHLLDDKSAPAVAFSHYWETTPAPVVGRLALQAAQRDQVESIVSRKALAPFPGVELGHVPGFHASPSTSPIIQPYSHFGHHSHQVESKRQTRRRFMS
jgi:hypothetical protein